MRYRSSQIGSRRGNADPIRSFVRAGMPWGRRWCTSRRCNSAACVSGRWPTGNDTGGIARLEFAECLAEAAREGVLPAVARPGRNLQLFRDV